MAKAVKPPKPPKPGTPPTLPKITGLIGQARLDGVYLQWDAFPGATAYWVHRNTDVTAIIQHTTYIDVTAQRGNTYIYYIRGVVNGAIGAQSDSITINF